MVKFMTDLDEDELLQTLGQAGYQTSLGDFTANGGDIILIGNQVVGWLYQDGMGVLESMELLPTFRRQGIGKSVLDALYGGQPFKAFMPNEQGMALLRSYGEVVAADDGYVTVTPRGAKARLWLSSNCRFASLS